MMLAADSFQFHYAPRWTLVCGLVMAAGLTAILVVSAKRRGHGLACATLCGAYIAALVTVSLAKMPGPAGRVLTASEKFNGVPGIAIVYAFYYNIIYMEQQFLANVLLFVPLGVLEPVSVERLRSLARVLSFAIAVSILIEVLQWLDCGSNRVGDANDVLCNVVGAATGYCAWKLWAHRNSRGEIGIATKTVLVGFIACFLLLLARPAIHFATDYEMADSAYNNPGSIADPIRALPVSPETLATLKPRGGLSSQSATKGGFIPLALAKELVRAGDFVEGPRVTVCSAEEAVRRARYGVIVSVYHPAHSARTWEMRITSAELGYVENKNDSLLLPVWMFRGVGLSSDVGKQQEATQDDLFAEMVVPA